MGIRRIYLNGLGLGGRVNGVSGQTLYLFHYDSTHNGDTNLPGVVGLEPPLAGQMPKDIVHKAAVRVGQLKFNACQRLLCDGIHFFDHEIPGLFVVKTEDIGAVIADLNGFGNAVQHHTLGYLDLPHGDGGPRFHAWDHHPAIIAGDELAVAVAHNRPTGISDQEGDTFQGLVLAALLLEVLLDNEGIFRAIIKICVLHIVRVDHDGLAPGLRVDGIAGNRGLFSNDHRAHDPSDGDGPVRPGIIDAVGGYVTVFIVHNTAGGIGYFELYSRQGRFPVQAAVLMDDQGTQRLVEQLDVVGAGTLDLNGFWRIIQKVSGFAFDLLHDIAAWLHGDFDEARLVRSELAVGLAHNSTVCPGDADHHIAQRLLGGGGHLLDDEVPDGLVVKIDALVVIGVDHDSLALAVFIDQVARDRGNFSKYQRPGYAADVDLALGISIIDAVGGQLSADVVHYLSV